VGPSPDGSPSGSELEEFFDLSADLLCIVGFDGSFKRVNPALVATLGFPEEELLARTALEITHPDDVASAAAALGTLATGRDLVRFEARVVRADGEVRWLEWNTRSVPERGVVYGAGRDTTERRRSEGELRDAQRELEASRDKLRVLAEEQGALRRVATLVAHGAPPSAVFDAVTAEVAELLSVSAVTLARYEGDELTVLAQRGHPHVHVGDRFPIGGTNATSTVLRTGRPARVDDAGEWSGWIGDAARRAGVRSVVAAPLVVDGRTWGMLAATWTDSGPPPANTEERMAGFAELLDTAIANADSRDQLTASRARVLAAGDLARRRVVRDLHDGAQQRLVHTIVMLKLAQQAHREGRDDVDALLVEALGNAERATAELRELAHGILPTALTEGGLRAAVEAYVSRVGVPVDVDVARNRLPSHLEATAYFIVAEALTNVTKHARATCAAVRAVADGGELALEVRDDGVGGADLSGHGLLGVADRVDALGGRLRIASTEGDGTVLVARLPLRAPDGN
jgi:PAS domain S-box-containing protein